MVEFDHQANKVVVESDYQANKVLIKNVEQKNKVVVESDYQAKPQFLVSFEKISIKQSREYTDLQTKQNQI